MKARYKIIFTSLLITLIFIVLFSSYGYNNTWRLWNIPTLSQNFADVRVITHGAESRKLGFDPMIENPGDPWQRKLNYPRIWQSLYSIGINRSHSTYIGIFIIFTFLVGVCLVLPNADNKTITLVSAALISPAVLLGIERGNIDLLIFFLAAVSVLTIKRSYFLSALLLVFAFILKFYPVFGCSLLLNATRKKFLASMAIIAVVAACYILFTFSDILLVSAATPRSTYLSYGMNVFWMNVSNYNETLGIYARIFSYLSVLLVFILAFSAFFHTYQFTEHNNDRVYLDSFRVGAAIICGTFLIGNNWDYRLVFVIFTLPQLIFWTKVSDIRISTVSKVTIVVIFISLWNLIMSKILGFLPYGNYIGFLLDEASNWLVFSGLLYVFLWSAPEWVRDFVEKIYPFRKLFN